MIEKTLFEQRKKKTLTYQDLEKMADNEWVLVNSNGLYYLLSYYQGKSANTRNSQWSKILLQHFEDIKILRYYTVIDEEKDMYQHLSLADVKIHFRPWAKEKYILSRSFVALKEDNSKFQLLVSQLPELRNLYIQDKQLEEEKQKHQQELVYRKQKGYIV